MFQEPRSRSFGTLKSAGEGTKPVGLTRDFFHHLIIGVSKLNGENLIRTHRNLALAVTRRMGNGLPVNRLSWSVDRSVSKHRGMLIPVPIAMVICEIDRVGIHPTIS